MTDITTTTTEATTDGSADADYQAQVTFASPPQAVFDALTTTSGLTDWWTAATGDGTTGGELRFDFGQMGLLVLHVDAAQPASPPTSGLVQWTCLEYPPLPDWPGTTISFELSPRSDGGCDLSFRHRGLTPRLVCYQDCKSGWDHFLPSLRALVDAGAGNPWASSVDVERRAARDQRPGATITG